MADTSALVKVTVDFYVNEADVAEVYTNLYGTPTRGVANDLSDMIQDYFYNNIDGPQLEGEYRIVFVGENAAPHLSPIEK